MTFTGLCFSSETEFPTHSLPEFELYARPMSSDILIFTLSSEYFKRPVISFPSSFVYHDQGQIQTLQLTGNGFDRSMSLVQMCQAFLDLTIPSNHTKVWKLMGTKHCHVWRYYRVNLETNSETRDPHFTQSQLSLASFIHLMIRFVSFEFYSPALSHNVNQVNKLCYIIVMAASKYQCV